MGCEIGSGAREPLRAILAKEGIDKSEALQSLPRKLISLRDRMHNYFGNSAGKHFKKVLGKFEAKARARFKKLTLLRKQMCTSRRPLSCSSLQVQLCEFRQFKDFIKR